MGQETDLSDLTLNGGSTKAKNIKFDLQVLERINGWKDEVDNMHTSKFLGEVMSEILQNDPIADMEEQTERALAEELGVVPVVSEKDYLDEDVQEVIYQTEYFQYAGEFSSLSTKSDVGEDEEYEAIRNSYTVRQVDAEQLGEAVHGKQQSYWLNRISVRLLDMPFQSRIHRLQSKEQLLKHARGDEIVSPTPWIEQKMEESDGVFAEILRGVDTTMDVSQMEPEDFDALEDGLDPSEHDLTQVNNGDRKKHALWAVARFEGHITPDTIKEAAEDIYPDMTEATYDSYTEFVFDKITNSEEGEVDNFVPIVEGEVRERTKLEKWAKKDVDGIHDMIDLLNNERHDSRMGILSDTVQLLRCLDRLYEDTPNTSNHKIPIKDLRNDIALLALDHFQLPDIDITDNPLFERMNQDVWLNKLAETHRDTLESGDASSILIDDLANNPDENVSEEEAKEDFEEEINELKEAEPADN